MARRLVEIEERRKGGGLGGEREGGGVREGKKGERKMQR